MNLDSKQKGQYGKEALHLDWVSTRLPVYSSSTEKFLSYDSYNYTRICETILSSYRYNFVFPYSLIIF